MGRSHAISCFTKVVTRWVRKKTVKIIAMTTVYTLKLV